MGAIRFRVFTGDRPLTANRNKHWRQQHRNTNDWQAATFDALREASVRTSFDRVGFRFHPFYPAAKRKGADPKLPDADGLAPTYKAIVDACVSHGMVADDNAAHVAYKHFAAAEVDDRLEWPVVLVIVIPKAAVHLECTCREDRERRQAKAAV